MIVPGAEKPTATNAPGSLLQIENTATRRVQNMAAPMERIVSAKFR